MREYEVETGIEKQEQANTTLSNANERQKKHKKVIETR